MRYCGELRQGGDGGVTRVSVAGLPPAEVGRVEDSTGPRVMAMDGQTTPATILLYIPLQYSGLCQVRLR